MYDVITIGGVTLDVFIKTDASKIISIREPEYRKEFLSFDYGKKIYLDNIRYSPGGGGNNTAVSFARLGLKAAFIGCIGQDDEGRRLLRALKKEGVMTDFISRIAEDSTGLSVILNSFEGDRTVFSFRGANNKLTKDIIDWPQLQGSKWFYIPSLSGESQYLLPELVMFAQKNKIRIGCNPGSEQLRLGIDGLKYLVQSTDVFILNKEEAEQLTNKRARHRAIAEKIAPIETMRGEPWISDMRDILRSLHAEGAKVVVITEGIKGAHAYDGEHFYWMPVYPYDPIDTLGAGDAFASSFIAARIMDKSISQCLQVAAANASLVVREFGAQPGLGDWTKVQQVINKHKNFKPVKDL